MNSLVNDVDNTVGNKDIRNNDARVVDENTARVDSDGQVPAVRSRNDGAVSETRAVGNSSIDDMVTQNVSDLLGGQVGEAGSNGLEGGVVGSKDGKVRRKVNGISQVLGDNCSTEGSETSSQ